MSKTKRSAAIFRHGDTYFVGALSFFSNALGAATSTTYTLVGDTEECSDEVLGRAVLDMVARSGVMDTSLIAPSGPGTSFESTCLGLPSESVLESEAVTVSVTLKSEVLIVRPMQTMGPGGGFTGMGHGAARLDPGSVPAVVGASVREATEAAIDASKGVLRPAGSWRGGTSGPVLPPEGVVTVRRDADGWTVTSRMGDRWTKTAPSTGVERLGLGVSHDDLGRAVVEGLSRAGEGGLRPGAEDPTGGELQLLVEADDLGLTICPQVVDPGTGEWDVPAHPDVRTLVRQSSTTDVGQSVMLAAEEVPKW